MVVSQDTTPNQLIPCIEVNLMMKYAIKKNIAVIHQLRLGNMGHQQVPTFLILHITHYHIHIRMLCQILKKIRQTLWQ